MASKRKTAGWFADGSNDDGKRRDRRPASPRRQGHLDALCGVYAILNAFAYATRDQPLRYFPTKRLFMHLIEAATRQRGDTSFIGDGLPHAELKHLCKKAVRFYGKQGYRFTLMPPKSFLLDNRYPRNPEDVRGRCTWFATASRHPSCSVILEINTPWVSHWSVLNGATADQRLALYDSNGMRTVAITEAEPFIVIARGH